MLGGDDANNARGTGDTFGAAGTPVPADGVPSQLARILSSGGFVSSQRLCRFLRFIVERTLENDTERLKEFVVAMEVFDRNEDYNPSLDFRAKIRLNVLIAHLRCNASPQ